MDQSLLASIRNFKKTELSEAETVDKSVPEGVVPQPHLASTSTSISTSTTSSRSSRSTIKSRSHGHARVASSDSLFGGSNGRSGSDQEEEEDEEQPEVKPNCQDLRKPTISRPAGNSSLFTDVSDEITRELMIGFVEQLKSGKPLNVIMMVMRSRLPDERLHERVLQAAGMSSSSTSTSTSVPTSPVSSAGSATSPKSKRKKEKRKKEKRTKNASSDEHEMTSTRRPPTSPGPQDRVSDIESILGTQRQIKKAEKKSHIPPPLIHTPIKQGWMNKQSRYLKQWRCRWFVLQGDTLYTFKSQHVLEKPTETISLKTYNAFQPITDISMPINAMELSSKDQPKLRTFTIDPLNEQTKDEWIRVLEKAIRKAART